MKLKFISLILLLASCGKNTDNNRQNTSPNDSTIIEEEMDLADDELSQSFIKLCKNKSNNRDIQHTFNVLMEYKKKDSCDELEESLSSTKSIFLQKKYLVDISPLYFFTNIEELELSYNFIDSLEGIKNLKNLKVISLTQNRIIDIAEFQHLQNLEHVFMSLNRVSSLKPFKYLSDVKTLDMSFNKIEDAYPLRNLTKLKSLDLSYNPIAPINCPTDAMVSDALRKFCQGK